MWNWTPKDENKPSESFYPEATHIGKSIVIKGEVSGSKNAYVAGELEGSIELLDGNLTAGPKDISAPTCKRAASWFTVEWTEPCAAPSALI